MILHFLLNKPAQMLRRHAARLGLALLVAAGLIAFPYTLAPNGLSPSRAEAGFFSHEVEVFALAEHELCIRSCFIFGA